MKITAISDIHGMLSIIKIEPCDVLCICGDIINLNDQRDLIASYKWWTTRFVKWVNEQPCNKVFITPGNHDFFIESVYHDFFSDIPNYTEFKSELSKLTHNKLVLLIDEEYIYGGLKFYGTPWINKISFSRSEWAFENNNNQKCAKQFDIIPEDVDILLTHDSPINNETLGIKCESLSYDAHFYGHWHSGESDLLKKQYNCSYLNDMYNVEDKRITIEVEPKKNKPMLYTKCDVIAEIYDQLKAQEALISRDQILQWIDTKYLIALSEEDNFIDDEYTEDEYGVINDDDLPIVNEFTEAE